MTAIITTPSREGIEAFDALATEFMQQIFGFEPGDYLITDLSDLRDFVSPLAPSGTMETVVRKVMDTYHLSLVPNNLLALFREIHRQGGRH